ncbi:hypothetical protein BG015_002122 [Linnemannia schmuckeri]|uniref:F-box domain-containing protein n=1 Tax=Linnemannia schmuckeri TaxID=64567 RepID=A0A9P5RNX0_9FUNG|nr:hypothetical protein BG015_002122 [Linnemannia schmuckeri]
MPPHSHLNAMERAFNLPELMTILGTYLPQEDLYACTLVNRQWHDTFIPILWHTIDDKTGSWSDILRYYDDYTCHYGFDKQWLHGIFRKYGHHIRHLSAEWAPIIIAANDSGVCTNLLSFKTNNVGRKMTDRQLWKNAQGPPPPPPPPFDEFLTPPPIFVMSHFNPPPFYQPVFGTTTQRPISGSSSQPASASSSTTIIPQASASAYYPSLTSTLPMASPLTSTLPTASPPFLDLAPPSARETAKRRRGVKQVIDPNKGQAQNLAELDTPQSYISLPRLLDLVPSLQRLTTLGQMDFRAFAEEEQQRRRQQQAQHQPRWPNFRGLKHEQTVNNNELLWLLLCFPDLEDLEVEWDYRREHLRYGQELNLSKTYSEIDPSTWLDMKAILLETTRQQPLKLKRLHLKLSQYADPLLPVLLPYLPSLTELILPHLDREIANALVTHCPGLQIFRIDKESRSYFRRPRESSLNWTPDLNIANILLANCRDLRVFEGPEHMIEIETLYNQHPWACGSKLEVLRVQFGGFEKLDDDEQLALETGSLQSQELVFNDHDGDNKSKYNNTPDDVDEDKDVGGKIEHDIRMAVLREKYEHSKSQHILFTTLGQFHNLRILDLGPFSMSVDYHPPATTNEQQGQQQQLIDEADHHVIVVPGTPSLTLEYGLSQLSTLQNLRVLNFEAVDHRLEKKDVIWLATHLKGLRHVYGLHVPKFTDYPRSYQASLDYRRTMLRTEFKKHKAIVRHDNERM